MDTNQILPVSFSDRVELTIPEFGSIPAITLDITLIRKGESRILEARVVTAATYCDLEFQFNESYREARKHLAEIGYQITRAEKALREAKSIAILDEYPVFLKEKNMKDNANVRDAFLERQINYVAAQDRIDLLKALEALMDGKVKNFESVCRYIKKQMDLVIRSGSIDSNKYLR